MSVEFITGWDDHIKEAVTRTICPFSNDLVNLNGGYLILGVEDPAGCPVSAPRGLSGELEAVQRKFAGNASGLSRSARSQSSPPAFKGSRSQSSEYLAGDARPYEAPPTLENKDRVYFVRRAAETAGEVAALAQMKC